MAAFTVSRYPRYTTVCDLGSGAGLLALILGALNPVSRVTGVELQQELVQTAESNAKFNQMENRVSFTWGDLRDQNVLPGHYSQDLVIANPPFRKIRSGKVSPRAEISRSCHEITATLSDYVFAAALILKHNGCFACVTLPERFIELSNLMMARKLTPTDVQFVHHFPDHPANAVLILARKNGRAGLRIYPPKIVRS